MESLKKLNFFFFFLFFFLKKKRRPRGGGGGGGGAGAPIAPPLPTGLGAREHEEVFFVSFRFVSGFHTSWNLRARMGDHFSFSVARDQMLVAWGDRVPLEHSRAELHSIESHNKQSLRTLVRHKPVQPS